jgi:hypothetical protein
MNEEVTNEEELEFEAELKTYTDDQVESLYWFSDALHSGKLCDILEKEVELRKIKTDY